MIAALKDRSTSAKMLLEAGADVNAAAEAYGTTVLMMAAMNGYDEVVAVLLQHSPRLDERNKSGFTALMLAARNGHMTVVQQLLNAGASKYETDYAGRRAADHATDPNIKKLLSI
jgi:ankyrin repeat protein